MVTIFYTESRSGYVGLAFAVVALIVFAKKRNLLLVGIAIGIIFSSILIPERARERITYTFKRPTPTEQFGPINPLETLDTSTQARLTSWKEAYSSWKKYPLLGWGVTGYTFLDAQYMKVLVETGAFGIITFIYLLYSIGLHAKRVMKFCRERDPFWKGISLGYFAGFIGLCGHALGTNTFIIIRIMEPFWLLTGIVIYLPTLLTKQEEEEVEVKETEKEEDLRGVFFR